MKAGLEDYVPQVAPSLRFASDDRPVRPRARRAAKASRKLEEELRQSQDNYRHAQKMEAIGDSPAPSLTISTI
jgi:hypothetical protein